MVASVDSVTFASLGVVVVAVAENSVDPSVLANSILPCLLADPETRTPRVRAQRDPLTSRNCSLPITTPRFRPLAACCSPRATVVNVDLLVVVDVIDAIVELLIVKLSSLLLK